VALPTVAPSAAESQSLGAQIEKLRGDNEALTARLEALEASMRSGEITRVDR
jgi:hypothetical protein